MSEVARELKLDKSAASRRIHRAGLYIKNQNPGRGRRAELVPGEPLPEDRQLLPTTEELARCCTVAAPPPGDQVLELERPLWSTVEAELAAGRVPLPGDGEYVEWLEQRREHLTTREWRGRRRFHFARFRLTAPPDHRRDDELVRDLIARFDPQDRPGDTP